MLKRMCSRFACRNIAVNRRHQSPSATSGPKRAPSANSLPPGEPTPPPWPTVIR
jgi:hypothetical protein